MKNTWLRDMCKEFEISDFALLCAKLWDVRQQTRKYKKKLERKRMYTWMEKEMEYRKYHTRIGQFRKRGMYGK